MNKDKKCFFWEKELINQNNQLKMGTINKEYRAKKRV